MGLKKNIIIVVCLLVGLFLYNNDPVKSHLAPQCMFKTITGLSCPGCGFQRYVHALLHGDILCAIRYNLFLALGIPFLLFVAVSENAKLSYPTLLVKKNAAYLYILLYFAWFVVRNVYDY